MTYRALLTPLLVFGTLTFWTPPAQAQEDAAMAAWQKAGQPGKHHKQLAALVGTWQAESRFWTEPSGEPMVSPATFEYRMIMDGRYLEENVTSEFMGQPFKGRGLYGFNNVTGELEAVWIDGMSTGIYRYSGSMSEDGSEMTLKGKYKDPASGEWKESRTVMRVSKDSFHYTGYEMEGGKEWKMMEITATRKM